jgi:hypothetical protein
VKSESEMIESSRYAPTCSLTPGWSRTIWPAETPRMRHLALSGPQVLHGEAGDVRGHALDVVRAAARSSASVGAAIEKGTSDRFCSRSMAVTRDLLLSRAAPA